MKHITRVVLILIIVAAVAVFSATLLQALWFPPIDSVALPATTTPARVVPPDEQPARLIIPAIDLDADMQYVGVTAKGNMGVPDNFTDVGWYKYGTVPGQKGSAVIAGHVDNALALAGVFKRLHELKPGDDVYVERKDGTRIHFIVESAVSYPYAQAPVERIFNRDSDAFLNLITCGGTWIRASKTYDKRLVVYTKLVR